MSCLHLLEPLHCDTEPAPKLIPLAPRAHPVLAAAQQRLADDAGRQSNPLLQNHLMQLIDYLPRIALIHQLCDSASEVFDHTHRTPDFLDGYAITSASRIIDWYAHELCQIYASAPIDAESQKTREILSLIQTCGGQITSRELMRARSEFRSSSQEASRFLNKLAQDGLGQMISIPTKGRPRLTFKLACDSDTTFPISAQIKAPSVTKPLRKSFKPPQPDDDTIVPRGGKRIAIQQQASQPRPKPKRPFHTSKRPPAGAKTATDKNSPQLPQIFRMPKDQTQ